jgi:1-acyl-sn-glycerol-3-phosphate acyltransferase
MRGRDLETTRKACAKFSLIPTSVMNFPEGTRFTKAKHARQQSPYRHLLRPKAGGVALTLNAMGDRFRSLLNVTIVYPDGAPGFWEFLCGRVRRIVVRMEQLPIPGHFIGADYENDTECREAFQQWLQDIWQEKDRQIAAILAETSPAKTGRP